MFPLHCVVQTLDQECPGCFRGGLPPPTEGAQGSALLADTFAVIANETPVSNLTDTVLFALGLQEFAGSAVGKVQIRNWKLLALSQVTDNLEASAESILKDVSNAVTLVILVKRSDGSKSSTIDSRVQSVRNQILQRLCSPDSTTSNALDWITEERGLRDCARLVCTEESSKVSDEMLDNLQSWLQGTQRPPLTNGYGDVSPQKSLHPPTMGVVSKFNNLIEVPKLQRWFNENQNPTRARLMQYMGVLNGTNFRRIRPKITYQQICNWFSNARAAQRRSQVAQSKVCNPKVRNSTISFNSLMYPESVATVDSTANVAEGGQEVMRSNNGCNNNNNSNCSTNNNNGNNSESGDSVTEGHTSSVKDEPGTPVITETNGINWSMEMVTSETPEDQCLEVKGHGPTLVHPSPGDRPASALLPTLTIPTATASHSQPTPLVPNQHRSRLMFDPLSEIPLLERWFEENPHPSWTQIDDYTKTLNSYAYRETYPPVTTYNVKIWFKNRRAKNKRLGLLQNGTSPPPGQMIHTGFE